MAASSEIRYKIGADTSAFSKGMVALETIADGAGKAIERKLGLKDAFKSSVIALGLSIEGISKKIAAVFSGGSIDTWREGLDAAVQATELIVQKQLSRLDTARKIAALEKEIATNARDEDPTQKAPALTGLLGKLGPNMQRNVRATLNNLGVGEFESEADAFARSQKAQGRRLKLEQQIDEVRSKGAENLKRIEELRRSNAIFGADDTRKLVAAIEEEKISATALADLKKKGLDTSEAELDFLNRQKAVKEAMLKIEQAEATEVEKKLKAAEKAYDLAEKQRKAALAQGTLSTKKEDPFADAIAARNNRMSAGINERAKRFEDSMGIRDKVLDAGNFGTRSRETLLPLLEDKTKTLSGVVSPGDSMTYEESAKRLTEAANDLKEAAALSQKAFEPVNVDN